MRAKLIVEIARKGNFDVLELFSVDMIEAAKISANGGATVDKDQVIAYLWKKTQILEKIVTQIDRDVQEATAKYLGGWKPSFPGEKVTFALYLKLLEGEMRKALRFEWVNAVDSPLRKEMEASVVEKFEQRLATEIIGNRLSVVVFTVREDTVETAAGPVRRPVFKASCVERGVAIEGTSPADAIQKWIHRLRCKLVKGPITRLPFPEDPKLKSSFENGKLLQEETVGIFTVTVKGYPAKIFEASQAV